MFDRRVDVSEHLLEHLVQVRYRPFSGAFSLIFLLLRVHHKAVREKVEKFHVLLNKFFNFLLLQEANFVCSLQKVIKDYTHA